MSLSIFALKKHKMFQDLLYQTLFKIYYPHFIYQKRIILIQLNLWDTMGFWGFGVLGRCAF